MKILNITFFRVPNTNLVLLVVALFLTPHQFSYAQNKVVVVPLFGDDTSTIDPTELIAKDSPSVTDYVINSPFTAFDKVTRLQWQREDDNTERSWNEALDYCSDLILGAKSDWYLPDILELQSILDYGRSVAPIINTSVFPGTESGSYWSSSIGSLGSEFAWGASFDIGFVGHRSKSADNHVRCVRQQTVPDSDL